MSFFDELKRRNVFRVAIAYVVLAWLMAQVAELLLEAFGAPPWVLKSLLALLLVGFPIVVFFAWAFELTPDGVKRERDIDRERSITGQTGRKLDQAIIVMLVLALGWFVWDSRQPAEVATPTDPTTEPALTVKALDVTDQDARPVVAVLPFKAIGSDDGGFLAAGLHDDLLTRLTKLDGFRVISRTSMMEYADTIKNMRQIGEELGAGYILEGGVQAREGRVRINAQLIQVPADEHLWAEVYTRDLTANDLFDIQAELAVAIAEQTHSVLSPADKALIESLPTDNLQAYNAYLRGRQLDGLRGFVGPRSQAPLEAYEEAVQHDPDFALAWARVATARVQVYQGTKDNDSAETALEALNRARSLQPGLLEAELAWAEYLYRVQSEYEQALSVIEALGEHTGRNYEAVSMKAYLLRRLGRYADAYETMQEATRLEPRMPGNWTALALMAVALGDCETAKQHNQTGLSLAPDSPDIRTQAAMFELECNGNAQRAKELLDGVPVVISDTFIVATDAAWILGDRDWILSLQESEFNKSSPWSAVFAPLSRAEVLRTFDGDEAAADKALSRAGEELALLAQDPKLAEAETFAFANAYYYGLLGDRKAVVHWIAEHKRRYRREYKGDVSTESQNRLYYAQNLALAGLLDEAIMELKIMLEGGGKHRYPYVKGFPQFSVLKDHPDYVELRERFGEIPVVEKD